MCTEDFVIPPKRPHEKSFTLRKGESVMIPTYAIQMNEEFFHNPDNFDPERFSEENIHKIQQNTFIPFGIGPRACIGSRFALLEAKVLFVYLLKNFRFVKITKSPKILEPSKKKMKIEPDEGFWVGLEFRNKIL